MDRVTGSGGNTMGPSTTTAGPATGNESSSGRPDVVIIREFLCEVGVAAETVHNSIWVELRGYLRGRLNL